MSELRERATDCMLVSSIRDEVTDMARERYRVTEEDRPAVVAYIRRKFATEEYWLDSDSARRAFVQVQRDPGALNAWCEKWLSGEQWEQLKNAVRATRKRFADRSGERDPKVNVTLSRHAWLIVRALAKRERVTLSEFLEGRFEQEWLDMEEE